MITTMDAFETTIKPRPVPENFSPAPNVQEEYADQVMIAVYEALEALGVTYEEKTEIAFAAHRTALFRARNPFVRL